MKRSISLLCTFAMLLGLVAAMAIMPANAALATDANLITHWDFSGDEPLKDKAANGGKTDTLVADDITKASVANGTITVKKGGSLYAEDSADFMRTTEDRTIAIYFRTDTNGSNSQLELMSQNGSLRWFSQNGGAQYNASTSSDAAGENSIWTSNITFKPNTWYFMALIQDKDVSSGALGYKMYVVDKGDGAYRANFSKSGLDHENLWTRNTNGKGDNNLYIGRRHTGPNASGDLEIADIRIYNRALGLGDLYAIYSEVFNGNTRTNVDIKHSLTLGGDIGVNFYVKPVAYVQDTDSVVTISKGEEILATGKFNADYEAHEVSGYYKFTGNVAAKEMADDLTISIKKGDTNLYLLTGTQETYSVLDYAKVILADEATYANEIPLVKAMLNYGGYAQSFFAYNTENLANADITADPLPNTPATGFEASTGTPLEGVESVKATLKLESQTQVVFTVTFAAGVNLEEYTVNGEVPASNTVEVLSNGINAQDLDLMQTLEIKKGDATQTVSYAGMTYIQNVEDATVTDLLKALYAFHLAAETYASLAEA